MATPWDNILRTQLLERRRRLETAIPETGNPAPLVALLQQVDSTLENLNTGAYGLCEACHGTIEADRLLSDPLVRTCLECLNAEQRRALEQDLELASRIQGALLPKSHNFVGWEVCFHYQPAGAVSGDYCDLVGDEAEAGAFYFLLGDISGKGISAGLLVSHLHALFRSLIPMRLSVNQLVARANRVFCESTVATHYATLVIGHAEPSGRVTVCNAGHCPPIAVRNGSVSTIKPTGLPIGIFCSGEYSSVQIHLGAGDSLMLYTDGLVEQENADGEYGTERLARVLARRPNLPPQALIQACLDDAAAFRESATLQDDLSVMVVRRVPQA